VSPAFKDIRDNGNHSQSLDTGGFQKVDEVMGVMIIPKVKQVIQSQGRMDESS
jgi:hypothetical protein